MKINLKHNRAPNTVSFFSKPKAYEGSVLSSSTLQAEVGKEATGYQGRDGTWIRKLKKNRFSLNYPEIVLEPTKEWYPSKYASFKLARKVDALWVVSFVPPEINASLWKAASGHTALRVPRDCKGFVKRLFRKNGLCYSRTTNRWRRRLAFDKWIRKTAKRGKYREVANALQE